MKKVLTKNAFKLSIATAEHTQDGYQIANKHPNIAKSGKRRTQNPKAYTFPNQYFENMKNLYGLTSQ